MERTAVEAGALYFSKILQYFQLTKKCYVAADSPKECVEQFEDYQECLFHRKELARLQNAARAQRLKSAEANKISHSF